MSTDIREDWTELGQRITKGIDTLGTIEFDQDRINAKISGLQGARSLYQSLSPEQYFNADKIWADFCDLVRARIIDAKNESDPHATKAKRTQDEGYVQGLELAISYTGGFGR